MKMNFKIQRKPKLIIPRELLEEDNDENINEIDEEIFDIMRSISVRGDRIDLDKTNII